MTYIPRSSSAIPDSAGSIPKLVRKKHTFRVFNILTTVAFVASLAGAAGLYLLNNYAETNLAQAQDALAQAGSADDKARMETIGLFDRRLSTASVLLENHFAPSRLFTTIEELTRESVQLSSLTYEYDPGFEATLTFSVNTEDLTSVALQRLTLAAGTLFSEFTMEDITTEAVVPGSTSGDEAEDTRVEAIFSGLLDESRFAYTGESSAPAQAPAAATGTEPTITLPSEDVTE